MELARAAVQDKMAERQAGREAQRDIVKGLLK
jgi:hypothetical protein